jgi:hypothetical protein
VEQPIPTNAVASAVLDDEFLVGVTILNPGFGYLSNPPVIISGGGGVGAQGFSTISNGMVTMVTMTNAGYGYTNAPTITIGQPPAPTFARPSTSQPGLQLLSSNLMPNETYQNQVTFSSSGVWSDFGALMTATNVNGIQFWPLTNAVAFYRMHYVP